MKKIFSLLFALCLAPAVWAAGPYQEGVHYNIIAEQGSSKPEVKEFFSYYCPHCHSFEPYVSSLAKALPAGTGFKKIHVDFMGQASKEVQNMLSQALVLAKLKGKSDEVSKAFFEHIHVQHKAFANANDVKAVVVSAGIDAATYDKEINNFMVKTQLKLMQKDQADYSQRKVLVSVPMFIVNGKYKINNEKLDQANIDADFKALVSFLLTK